jgi:hypothetical protein
MVVVITIVPDCSQTLRNANIRHNQILDNLLFFKAHRAPKAEHPSRISKPEGRYDYSQLLFLKRVPIQSALLVLLPQEPVFLDNSVFAGLAVFGQLPKARINFKKIERKLPQ